MQYCLCYVTCRWKLHENFIRILQAILNKSCKKYPTKQQLYSHQPPLSKTIQIRWTRHAGSCWRNKDELISDILLWTPLHRCASVGQPSRTYPQQFCTDTGCTLEDLLEVMDDREKWPERVKEIRAGSTSSSWFNIEVFMVDTSTYPKYII